MVFKGSMIIDLASRLNIAQSKSEDILNTVIDMLKDYLERGEDIQITKFGSFKIVRRNARRQMNPQTKQMMTVPAKNVVLFKPGYEVRGLVN